LLLSGLERVEEKLAGACRIVSATINFYNYTCEANFVASLPSCAS
jgi:hypothetical protein